MYISLMQQRREKFERDIREQEEEMLQQENEIKERQKWQPGAEEDHDELEQADPNSQNQKDWLLQYDYPQQSYVNSNSGFGYSDPEIGPTSPGGSESRHSQDSDSSPDVLSPVPRSTSWESDISEIELVKGNKGLGFSLLDYPVCFLVAVHGQFHLHALGILVAVLLL